MSSIVPKDLRFAKSHEWVRVNGDVARVGISDHAQHELTDVVFVELPPAGRRVKVGESCAVVESVKTASDIYAPVSGTVVASNEKLSTKPELVNTEPYGEGWLLEIRLSDSKELTALLDADAYAKQISA